MNINKDEARILAAALNDFKFRLNDFYYSDGLFSKLEKLEVKLENFGKDNRRRGRTTQDSFTDCLKRFKKV